MTDIYTTNGIIHVIDMVIVGDVEIPEPAQSIVDVAVEAGSFTTLVAALQATGLDTVHCIQPCCLKSSDKGCETTCFYGHINDRLCWFRNLNITNYDHIDHVDDTVSGINICHNHIGTTKRWYIVSGIESDCYFSALK